MPRAAREGQEEAVPSTLYRQTPLLHPPHVLGGRNLLLGVIGSSVAVVLPPGGEVESEILGGVQVRPCPPADCVSAGADAACAPNTCQSGARTSRVGRTVTDSTRRCGRRSKRDVRLALVGQLYG